MQVPRALAAALQICLGDFIHREDAVLGTGLDGHIADAEAVLHRQGLHTVTDEFQALVQCAGNADLTDQMQNDVLACGQACAAQPLLIFMAAGTLNQAMPFAIPAAISVEPTPVENAPTAP